MSVFGSGNYDRKKKVTVVCLTVVLLCQFLVLAGNRQFFCCGGKVLLRPRKKKLQSSVWRVVLLCQFLVLAITTEKKKFQSSVWRVVLLCQFLVLTGNRQFFCCGGKVLLRPEKKKLQLSVWRVVLLCQFLVLAITTGKK